MRTYDMRFGAAVEDFAATAAAELEVLERVQAEQAAARQRDPDEVTLMLSARVPVRLEQQVTALAARRGVSRSALVRELLRNAVAADSQGIAA